MGSQFFTYYEFYSGKDSAGSNGYNLYVSRETAEQEGIVKVVTEVVGVEDRVEIYENEGEQEVDWLLEDLEFLDELKRRQEDEKRESVESIKAAAEETKKKKSNSTDGDSDDQKKESKKKTKKSSNTKNTTRHLQSTRLEAFNPDPITYSSSNNTASSPTETFVYLSSSPTKEGPRNSIRLEGRRRFNRGLFIIDLRHMPAGEFVFVLNTTLYYAIFVHCIYSHKMIHAFLGCGTWPAFWLTDEANWPVNGEIDIVEGVNYQDTAKTALHTTKECRMDDVPEGSKTGT